MRMMIIVAVAVIFFLLLVFALCKVASQEDKYMELVCRDFEDEKQEFAEKFCDNYCKFPCEANNQDELDDICLTCPMNELLDMMYCNYSNVRK